MRVYPRVCGGTSQAAWELREAKGLSPRVRGNPAKERRKGYHTRVYPRVCGGTSGEALKRVFLHGLSPRVRGNPAGPLE